MKTLVANRGEISVRIQRALAGLGWPCVVAYVAGDDAHTASAQETAHLPSPGIEGYLDIESIIAAAVRTECEAVHPGYGFLSESAEFAKRCGEAGLKFVGPSPACLELFGNKVAAREQAVLNGIPVLPATGLGASVSEVQDLLLRQPRGVMIKAVAGGGGRGMREVRDADAVESAYERCRSEALRGFGNGSLFAEALMPAARHIEVQALGDGTGQVRHFWERDCSLQRRHQKLIEYTPSPLLPGATRKVLCDAAVAMLQSAQYEGLATVEFLVDADDPSRYVFLEVNPRLQVEHTITEEVMGVDLVQFQLRVAAGEPMDYLPISPSLGGDPSRFSIQLRVNAEQRKASGQVAASTGRLDEVSFPSEAGIRVDTHAKPGIYVDGTYDPLLAKIVVTREGPFSRVCEYAAHVADQTHILGIETNLNTLSAILRDPVVTAGIATNEFLDNHSSLWMAKEASLSSEVSEEFSRTVRNESPGLVLSIDVRVGDEVEKGAPLVLLEAMKMEHFVTAPISGIVRDVMVKVGQQVPEESELVRLELADVLSGQGGQAHCVEPEPDPDHVRPDLAEVLGRHEATKDAARPEAVARRHSSGHRTARENLNDLCDEESLVEYGALALAAQRSRRSVEDLIGSTPADGLITGLATANAATHGPAAGKIAVLAYDYTVLAGTQGHFGHKKADRILALAYRLGIPVVLLAEGGGGRPGDVDTFPLGIVGMDTHTFGLMADLSGSVPTVGVVTGRCFAGNAAMVGTCDVIIATRDSSLGMAGPAMIEAAGLGHYEPEDVGPMSVQGPNGVVDIIVEDDAEAIETAKRYLSYFQGNMQEWTVQDQRELRTAVGENRRRAYDIRRLIDLLADTGSVLELRRGFAPAAVTALVRIEGRSYGLIANDPAQQGGTIDSPAADKFARFLQLCDAHETPVISLCDTPGFIVGPSAESTASVRHLSRLFVIGAHLRVPMVTVIVRKAYGLGANAMAGGHGFHGPVATVAWPTGEIGAMGLEGAVQLGFSRELEGIADPQERSRRYDELVAEHYESGRALSVATAVEFDDVIDPADTRRWIASAIKGFQLRQGARRYVDAW